MDNNYFSQVGSYMQPIDPQELAKLSPSFQNIGQQQAMQNAAMQQGNQLTQAAGQTGQQGGGMNPMAMALRNKQPQTGTSNFGARADMAFNSQATPGLQNQVAQLGSSTWNPLSDYNMGTNGWGNYGE